MLNYSEMQELLVSKYGAIQETPHLFKIKLGKQSRSSFLKELHAQAKDNVHMEFHSYGPTRYSKDGYHRLYMDINEDYPVEVELLSGPIMDSLKTDPLWGDMVAESRKLGKLAWFIHARGYYVWARFLEGPMAGDICTPQVPIGCKLGKGDKSQVKILVSNGTVYGHTRLVEDEK